MSSRLDDLPLSQRDLCFLDLETTGSVFGYHEIIDIAALRTSPSSAQVKGIWQRRVKPRHPNRTSVLARELTCFDSESWTTAVEPDAYLFEEFAQFVGGCVPVCHNPSFDRAFITLAATAAGVHELGLDYHWIGTESLAWPLYLRGLLPKLSLASLCEYLGVGCEPTPHQAIHGADACRRAYQALMSQVFLPIASEATVASSRSTFDSAHRVR